MVAAISPSSIPTYISLGSQENVEIKAATIFILEQCNKL